MKKQNSSEKKAQVTIFIIIAIMIVVGILLMFLFWGDIESFTEYHIEENPEPFLDSCIEPHVKEAAEIISHQGGYINTTFYRIYEGERISYLCYNVNNYLQCVNQQPMLIQHIKREIYRYIEDDVENCFQELKLNLEKQGAVVDLKDGSFEVELKSKKILINIERDLAITKADKTYKFEKFNSIIKHPIYDLSLVAQEIVNQESRFCNFVQEGYMIFYNQFDIDKLRTWDRLLIYTITDRQSKEYFRFAIKGCTAPPAY